jgi:hypothetical protein
VRVTGLNADGRVIAQTPGNIDSLAIARPRVPGPSTYSADKTSCFSLGGARSPAGHDAALTDGDVSQGSARLNLTVERHSRWSVPCIGPSRP